MSKQPLEIDGVIEDRYSRQVIFPGIGPAGQRKLLQSKIAIVGCGATGSTIAALLARAGVGEMRLIDRDFVEPSNLQRQMLFDEADAAESKPKAIAAAEKLRTFNSAVTVHAFPNDLTPDVIDELLAGAHLILDGADNFETRYLINDFAVKNGVPWIYTAAVGGYAASMSILPGETACLTCLFPDAPKGMVDTCDTVGILNSAASVAASISSAEAVKILVGAKAQLRKTLLSLDLWTNERAEVAVDRPRSDCATCAARNFIHLEGSGRPHVTMCGRNSVQIHERNRPVELAELGRRLAPHGRVLRTDYVLKFLKDTYEMTFFPDGRAIIKGTTDPALARSLYARYLGS